MNNSFSETPGEQSHLHTPFCPLPQVKIIARLPYTLIMSVELNVCYFLTAVDSLLSLHGCTALVDLGRFLSFLILYAVGKTPWAGDQPVGRPLSTHTTTQTQNKNTQYRHPCLEWDSNPRSQCGAGEDRSCLRPRGHCDRRASLLARIQMGRIGRSDRPTDR
jgi:hypothetical protein